MKRLGALLLSVMLAAAGARAAAPLQVATGGFRPVAYEEDGRPTGALCDVLGEASRRTGIPIEIHFLPWARSLTETQAGRIDAIFPIVRTPQRETSFAFPQEVLLSEPIACFARADSDIEIGPDLAGAIGRRIAIVNRSSAGNRLDQAFQSGLLRDVETVNETSSVVRLLAAGRVELIAGFDQAFWAEADHLGIQGLIRELSPRIDEIPVYIAFTRARDMSAESRSIDRALRAMKEDGTYQKILARYFVTKTQ